MANIDPGAPGKGGGAEGASDISTHKIILNKNAENALRRNNHNWGTNMFLINKTWTQNFSGLRFFNDNFTFRFLQKLSRRGHQICKTQNGSYTPPSHDYD